MANWSLWFPQWSTVQPQISACAQSRLEAEPRQIRPWCKWKKKNWFQDDAEKSNCRTPQENMAEMKQISEELVMCKNWKDRFPPMSPYPTTSEYPLGDYLMTNLKICSNTGQSLYREGSRAAWFHVVFLAQLPVEVTWLRMFNTEYKTYIHSHSSGD